MGNPEDSTDYISIKLNMSIVTNLFKGILECASCSATDYEVVMTKRLFEKPEVVRCDDTEEFVEHFNRSKEKDYAILPCDDPKKLLLGFLCLRGSRNTVYTIKLGGLTANKKAPLVDFFEWTEAKRLELGW